MNLRPDSVPNLSRLVLSLIYTFQSNLVSINFPNLAWTLISHWIRNLSGSSFNFFKYSYVHIFVGYQTCITYSKCGLTKEMHISFQRWEYLLTNSFFNDVRTLFTPAIISKMWSFWFSSFSRSVFSNRLVKFSQFLI